MRFLVIAVLAAFVFSSPARGAERLITIGGAVTETVFALGFGDQVVAVDSSSLYPESVTKLPQIGYDRTLSTEGVLALKPSMIIATSDAGPPNVIEQIRSAGVKLIIVKAEPGIEGAKRKIQETADALGKSAEGKALVAKIAEEMAQLPPPKPQAERPRVLFIYARGGGTLNVSGTGTAADAMIEAAGGRNAVTQYTGYKPLSAESAVNAAPDFILLTSRGLESLGGIGGVLKSPGLAETPAAKAGRIIGLDDARLLTFGPRTGEGVRELAAALRQ